MALPISGWLLWSNPRPRGRHGPTMDEVQTWEIHESLQQGPAGVCHDRRPKTTIPPGGHSPRRLDWGGYKAFEGQLSPSPKREPTKRSSSVLGEQEQQRVLALEDKKDEEEALKKKRRRSARRRRKRRTWRRSWLKTPQWRRNRPPNGSSESDSDPSSSSSSSTTKSHLRAEIGILSEAISCHQRIEEDNAQLTQKIGVLTEENLRLHARLRAALSWHGRLWRQLVR